MPNMVTPRPIRFRWRCLPRQEERKKSGRTQQDTQRKVAAASWHQYAHTYALPHISCNLNAEAQRLRAWPDGNAVPHD